TKTRKNPWISLDLFGGIGTFQWVTRKKGKKIESRLKLCANCLMVPMQPVSIRLDPDIQDNRNPCFCFLSRECVIPAASGGWPARSGIRPLTGSVRNAR